MSSTIYCPYCDTEIATFDIAGLDVILTRADLLRIIHRYSEHLAIAHWNQVAADVAIRRG